MQCSEIVTKLVYYLVWAYPGWLFILVNMGLGLLLLIGAPVRYAGARWPAAILLTAAELAGEMTFGLLLINLTGLSTGS
jgi:hypothetical protein